jgi:hypothetical protein
MRLSEKNTEASTSSLRWMESEERPEISYILMSNPHPFYSFRRLKKSDADYNHVRIRFVVESWILEK